MSECITHGPLVTQAIPTIGAVHHEQEIEQSTALEHRILNESPYRLESVETEKLAEPESTPTPNTYSLFTARQKRVILVAGSFAAFFSPVSSNIYFPALNTIAEDLHTSLSQINLTVTTYQVSDFPSSSLGRCH